MVLYQFLSKLISHVYLFNTVYRFNIGWQKCDIICKTRIYRCNYLPRFEFMSLHPDIQLLVININSSVGRQNDVNTRTRCPAWQLPTNQSVLRQDARTDAAHSARSVFRNTSHYTWQHTCTHTHIFAQPFVYSPRACSELWHFFHTPLLSMPSTAPFLSCSFLYTFCELPPFFERVFFQSYFRLFIPFFFLFFFLYTIRIFFWRNCFLFLIFYYNKYIYLFQKIL